MLKRRPQLKSRKPLRRLRPGLLLALLLGRRLLPVRHSRPLRRQFSLRQRNLRHQQECLYRNRRSVPQPRHRRALFVPLRLPQMLLRLYLGQPSRQEFRLRHKARHPRRNSAPARCRRKRPRW